MKKAIRIGVSSCLLGMKVRFDGNHKLDSYMTKVLDEYFEFIPSCPEVEIGMGIPRETIRLLGNVDDPTLIAPDSGNDHTQKMNDYSQERMKYLKTKRLHGYILKSGSPTCGMERVRVYDKNNVPTKTGIGLFARKLMEEYPLLPVEEEGRLKDMTLRENFVERVFAYFRLQTFLDDDPTPAKLVDFHTKNKMTIMAHNVSAYREMGRLVAKAGILDLPELLEAYSFQYMNALKTKANKKRNANVLYHLIGHFKKIVDSSLQQDMVQQIEAYRKGLVPLIVPISLIRHHLAEYDGTWLNTQTYLNPYPEELMLRNHV